MIFLSPPHNISESAIVGFIFEADCELNLNMVNLCSVIVFGVSVLFVFAAAKCLRLWVC